MLPLYDIKVMIVMNRILAFALGTIISLSSCEELGGILPGGGDEPGTEVQDPPVDDSSWYSGWFELPAMQDKDRDGVCFSASRHCPMWVAAPRHSMYSAKNVKRFDAYQQPEGSETHGEGDDVGFRPGKDYRIQIFHQCSERAEIDIQRVGLAMITRRLP